MTNRLLRLSLLAAAALLAMLTLVACGSHPPTTHGESEGAYVQAGPLIYQVQMSRELNPADVEDAQYLEGLSATEEQPRGDEEWFGVWVRVQNDTDEAHTSTSEFKIVDTVGTEYEPIELPESNPLVYRPTTIETDAFAPVQPDPESAAGTGVNNGELLLFKLSTDVYANRPIELEIVPPEGGEPSRIVLDL
jgi:hypothetical protein